MAIAGCAPGGGHPSRVHVLGRDYDRGDGTPLTLSVAQRLEPGAFVVVSNGRLITGHATPQPTVIFVRDHGHYYEYALSGGP
jgi:hypothetical protein